MKKRESHIWSVLSKLSVFVILFISTLANCNNTKVIDSLKKQLPLNNLDTYSILSKEFLSVNIDSSLYYINLAESMVIDADSMHKLPSIYLTYGNIYLKKSFVDTAKVFFLKAIELSKKKVLTEDLIRSYFAMTNLFFQTSHLDSAEKYLNKAWESAENHDSDHIKQQLLYLKGKSFLHKGNYSNAIDDLLIALEFSGKLKKNTTYYLIHYHLGASYMNSGFYDIASKHFAIAQEYYVSINDKYNIANGYTNDAYIKAVTGDLDGAFIVYLKAMDVFKEIQNYKGIARCLGSISTIYMLKGDFETALIHSKEALQYDEKGNDLFGQGYDILDIAEIYLKQEKYNLAKQHLLNL